MENRYKVILSNQNFYKEIEISPRMQQVRVGTDIECDARMRKELFFGRIELLFQKNTDGWTVSCPDNLYIAVGDVRRLAKKNLSHGDILEIRYQESGNVVFMLEFILDFDNGKVRYDRSIDISGCTAFSVGVSNTCTIVLQSSYVKNDHIEFIKNGSDLIPRVYNVTYGLYYNGRKICDGEKISNGDFFSVSDYFFYYKNGRLWTEIRSDMIVSNLRFADRRPLFDYPRFNRNARIRFVLDDEKIEVLDPPAKPQKPKSNLLSRLLPSAVMVVAGLALSFVSPFMLISSGIGIVTAIMGVIREKKDFKANTEERIVKYNAYIENKKREIEQYRKEECDTLEKIYISLGRECELFSFFSPDLFDREKQDEDFLRVRLGTGDAEAQRKIDYKKQERLEIEDELQQMPENLYKQYKFIQNAPVVCDLKLNDAMGIVGTRARRFEIMKNMVIDIAARHYYSDVKMVFVTDQENKNDVHWLRLLPHAYNEILGVRNIVCDEESKNTIFEYLYKELTFRKQNKTQDAHIVVFFFSECGFKSHPISRFIEDAKEFGVTFVFFGDARPDIPLGCDSLIEIKDDQNATLIDTHDGGKRRDFVYPRIATEQVEKIVNFLAPVYTEEISLESSLTKNISLFDLLHIIAVDDIDLNDRWSRSQVFKSMSAPIGVSKSSVVELDLHDKAHGPHGLVAGTTGSGKSEILQTYILSMVTLYHPYEVGFVIIDFKGGGMANQFKGLPHLLGAITDMEGKEISRSLKSIKAELSKRKRLFADAGVNHIDKYILKFKAGEVSEPLPHLIIIVDEFAELKAEQPEFMKELISAARIGRSLGVHLILATQKPSGQVSEQIWSNSRFKLCLKVQSQEDSNEVLKSPLAAEIKEPGRAYLQVGNGEIFELFQSAYSGAPEKTDDSNIKEFSIYALNESGHRTPVYVQKKQKDGEAGATQLEAIVKYVKDYCTAIDLKKIPDICIPALKPVIEYDGTLTDALSVPIGIYDDPDNQAQSVHSINIFSENTLIVGSSMTGKTNLLQLVIRGIACNYSPEEVNLYIIDFASMVLKNFERLNHVGGVVVPNEDEKFKNLFKMLNEEILARKEKLLVAGVSNFIAYKEAGYKDLPQIVLLVDNLTAVKELYFAEEDCLLPICREGLSVGVSVLIANPQTAGMGFKYLSNVNQRIAMHCSDSTEYHALFGQGKIQPENIPGRCLVEREKEIYEAQTYISFDGEKEFERVQEISAFVDEVNTGSTHRAKRIPVVPDVLIESVMREEFHVESDAEKMVVGLNFADVTPVLLDYSKQDILAVSGGHEDSRKMFINYIKKTLIQTNVKMSVLDDYSGAFEDISGEENVSLYSKNVEDITEMLVDLKTTLTERYVEREMHGIAAVKEMRPVVLIIHSLEAVRYISENKDALNAYKEIVKKYKNLKALIIFANIENDAISYNSPEVLKMMKQNCQFIVFEDLNSIKLFDCPLSLIKKFKAPLKENEAYFLSGNTLKKTKTIIKR